MSFQAASLQPRKLQPSNHNNNENPSTYWALTGYNSWCFIYPPVSITTNVEKLRDGDLKWLRQKQHTWEIENSSPTLSLSPSPSVCVSLCVCVHKAEAYMFGHVPSKSQENLNCHSSGVDVSFSSPLPSSPSPFPHLSYRGSLTSPELIKYSKLAD